MFAVAPGGRARPASQVFFFRAGQNWGNRAYFPKADRTLAGRARCWRLPRPVLRRQAAAPRWSCCRTTIDERALLAEALSAEGRPQGRDLPCPQRGEKASWSSTRSPTPARRSAASWPRASTQRQLLDGAGRDASGCAARRARIEVYDNSHIKGTNAVGAMIVAGPEGFLKQASTASSTSRSAELTPGDDFGMMREVLRRRFAPRCVQRGPGPRRGATAWPDLVLIDGGAGPAVGAAAGDRWPSSASTTCRWSAVAKGPDRDAGQRAVLPARARRPSRCRRATRCSTSSSGCATRRTASPSARTGSADATGHPGEAALDEIPGIGPTRKRALLQHFGTAKAIARASLDDLAQVARHQRGPRGRSTISSTTEAAAR